MKGVTERSASIAMDLTPDVSVPPALCKSKQLADVTWN
jgi:hypothetical protein